MYFMSIHDIVVNIVMGKFDYLFKRPEELASKPFWCGESSVCL